MFLAVRTTRKVLGAVGRDGSRRVAGALAPVGVCASPITTSCTCVAGRCPSGVTPSMVMEAC
jgi:hypothetical protein